MESEAGEMSRLGVRVAKIPDPPGGMLVFGTRTLQEIRQELRKRFALDGLTAVEWIKKRMVEVPEERDVLKAILAVLEGERKRKPKTGKR